MTKEEAIRILRETHDSALFSVRTALETLFPELKEYEDERIRKELKEAFEAYDIESKWNGIPIRSIFAWLEKQKEQKPISSCDIVPYIDDKIAALQDMWREEKVAFDWDDMHEMIEDVARHFYQKDQKQEWSDEDVDMLNSCISSIEEAKENRYAYKETDGDTSYDHEIAWLKSLRPQPHWKPTEEQMKALIDCTIGNEYDVHALVRLWGELKKLYDI